MNKYLFVILLHAICISTFGQSKAVEAYHETGDDGAVRIYARNNTVLPQSVKLEALYEEMTLTGEPPFTKLLEPKESKYFFTLTPNPNKSYSFNYKYTFIQGDVLAVHNDDHVYRLPFQKGEVYTVDQGYNEFPTHMDQYALDFHMDVGTTICAIRDGIVMNVEESNNKGCPEERCNVYNNFITIRHDDGSIADYSHIQKKGALVEIGQIVKAGAPIALSGATGWAQGAHLHLEVYVMRFSGQQSIPVEYYLDENTIGIPQSSKSYLQEL